MSELTQEDIEDVMFDFACTSGMISSHGPRTYRVLRETFHGDTTTRIYLSEPENPNPARGVQDNELIWVSFHKGDMKMWGDSFVWSDSARVHVNVKVSHEGL